MQSFHIVSPKQEMVWRMLELGVVKVLGAVFTPEFNITNALKIANVVFGLAGERLDGEPTMMAIPQDAPADIPRIILTSSDKLLSVSISPVRTNFEFKAPQETIIDMIDYRSYYSQMAEFFSKYSEALDLKVQRLGYVTERLIVRDDAISYVLERFCRDNQIQKGRPFYNTKRFEMHSLKNYEWDGFQVNSWVRIKCFPIGTKDQEKKPALLVENDLNTLSYDEDPGADFSAAEIGKYFDGIPDHLNEILNLYFPEE